MSDKALTQIIGLSARALDDLMPMHLWVGPTGHILHAGRTLQKLSAGLALEGAFLFDVVQFRRPRKLTDLAQLLGLHSAAVQVALRSVDGILLKGVVVALPDGAGALVNLSFGISVREAVRRFQLDVGDFAATDLAVEMLYLIEANSAVIAETQSLNQRLQQSKSDAEHRALTDTLTGLNNRRAMDIALSNFVMQPGPSGFGLMHVDLDHFKAVNDTLGHAAGDHVLLKVADVLRRETRAGDVVCRVGGDEFVLLLKDCNDRALLGHIASRIIAKLEEPIEFEGQIARVSASIGITLSSFYDTLAVDKILSDADFATYTSKHGGRARHTFHVPPSIASHDTDTLRRR